MKKRVEWKTFIVSKDPEDGPKFHGFSKGIGPYPFKEMKALTKLLTKEMEDTYGKRRVTINNGKF